MIVGYFFVNKKIQKSISVRKIVEIDPNSNKKGHDNLYKCPILRYTPHDLKPIV